MRDFDWTPPAGRADYGTLARFVQDNPDIVADYLDSLGVSRGDLEAHAGGCTFQ